MRAVAFNVVIVAPAKLAVSGLDGVYARVTVAGSDREGQIYSAVGDTAWEAIANAFESYVRRVVLRLRPNGAPLDDFGPDPFPPPRTQSDLDRRAAHAGSDEGDPFVRAAMGLPLWEAR
jgi:hypothetical protein